MSIANAQTHVQSAISNMQETPPNRMGAVTNCDEAMEELEGVDGAANIIALLQQIVRWIEQEIETIEAIIAQLESILEQLQRLGEGPPG